MMARASAANALLSMVTGVGFIIWRGGVVEGAVSVALEEAAEVSVGDHAQEFSRSLRTVVTPSFLRDIS